MVRLIALLDLDYFYAQCEQVRNPLLKNKPVVIVMPSLRENSGAIAACNYEARALKIKSGMPLVLAKKLSNPETVFINADKTHYGEVSQKVFDVVDFFCDKVEQVSIDEAYLELTNPQGLEKAKETCAKIKERIYSETGLTCSIGLSTNKLLAKMASEEKKPNGFFIVEEKEVEKFFLHKKIGKLYGVGPKAEEQLTKIGVKTIPDLKNISLEKLVELFGDAKGKMLFGFAKGIDEREITPNREKKQVSRMITLREDSRSVNFIKESVSLLSELVFNEAQQIDKKFKTVSIIIVTPRFETVTKSLTRKEQISSQGELEEIASELLSAFLNESLQSIRRIGVRVSNFNEDSGLQRKLFDFK